MTGQIDESNPENASSVKNVKKNRKRKKKLYKTIREQMEFYFSDSNMSKDKFMKDLIGRSENGFVDLEVFATFNKIKSLTPDVSEIAQALWLSSDILELNDDHTKVRRTTPVQPREDVDDCTIYVEHLPKHVDHAWLKRIFSSYGQVTYISLPKFKISGQPKGFAFVEFDTPTAAQRACEHLGTLSEESRIKAPEPSAQRHDMAFNSGDESASECEDSSNKHQTEALDEASKVTPSELSPETLLVKTAKKRKVGPETMIPFKKRHRPSESDDENKDHPKSTKISETLQPEETSLEIQEDSSALLSRTEPSEQKSSKKRHMDEDAENDVSSSNKKSRTDSSDEDRQSDSYAKTVQVSASVAEGEETNTALSSADESHRECVKRVKSDKKKRKRQKKSKAKMEQETLQLRVLSKCEWKRLKNRYLALQKANMSNLKRSLGCAIDRDVSGGSAIDRDVSGGKEDVNITQPTTDASAPVKKLEFQAQVVVKMTLANLISNPKALIEKVRSITGVQYVEAKVGQNEVFVRCQSPVHAQQLMDSEFVANAQEAALLEGEEEIQYWAKIVKDREENRQRTSKVKVRGREKILARADKAIEKSRHIYFDE